MDVAETLNGAPDMGFWEAGSEGMHGWIGDFAGEEGGVVGDARNVGQ